MTIEGLSAWAEDLRRLKRLERKRVFKSGYTFQSWASILRCLIRVAKLRLIYAIIPYPGPTVTESSIPERVRRSLAAVNEPQPTQLSAEEWKRIVEADDDG